MPRQKLEYAHQDPVKRAYVDEPEHWRWSSARNYAGRECLIEMFIDWWWLGAERPKMCYTAERCNEVILARQIERASRTWREYLDVMRAFVPALPDPLVPTVPLERRLHRSAVLRCAAPLDKSAFPTNPLM